VFAPGSGEDSINDLNRSNAVSVAAQAAAERDLIDLRVIPASCSKSPANDV
jgi:hypothetical protein